MTTQMSKWVPDLRFPEFSAHWVSSKAEVAFDNRRERGEAGLPIYSVTMNDGLVRRDSLERQFGNDAADESNLRAMPLDLVYNMMRMWQGAVGLAVEECMVSPAYIVLAPKEETHSPFYAYWFKSPRMLHLLWAYSHGLTSDRLRLYYSDFAQIELRIPSCPEQRKIASFLKEVDARSAALRKKHHLLCEYKCGVMQDIFSQKISLHREDGSKFPDWEEVLLKEIAEISKGEQINRDTLESVGTVPVINGGVTPSGFTKTPNESENTITISEGGNSCGHVAWQAEPFWLGGHCYSIKPKCLARTNNGFLFQALAFLQPSIMRLRVGSGLPNIQKHDLLKVIVMFPSFDEQSKIADFLFAIDNKIGSVAKQITLTETFKSGLLQKMFL